jgi:hypothetical protein
MGDADDDFSLPTTLRNKILIGLCALTGSRCQRGLSILAFHGGNHFFALNAFTASIRRRGVARHRTLTA